MRNMILACWAKSHVHLRMVCVGSIPSMISLLCEKGSKVLDLNSAWREESPGYRCYEVSDIERIQEGMF